MANQPNGKPVTDEYVKEQTRALIVGVLGKDEQAPMFETTYEFLCGHHMLDNISYGEGCYSVELAIDALEERNPWDDHRLCESVAVCLFEIVMDDSYVNEYKSYAWHAGLPPLLKCMESCQLQKLGGALLLPGYFWIFSKDPNFLVSRTKLF